MPPHPQHDAFVGPFHDSRAYHVGWAKRSVCPPIQSTNSVASGWWHGAEMRLCPPYASSEHHPLNQPWASPVKEKYNPAAVRAQDTTSMALSSCNPLSPMPCTSEITES